MAAGNPGQLIRGHADDSVGQFTFLRNRQVALFNQLAFVAAVGVHGPDAVAPAESNNALVVAQQDLADATVCGKLALAAGFGPQPSVVVPSINDHQVVNWGRSGGWCHGQNRSLGQRPEAFYDSKRFR